MATSQAIGEVRVGFDRKVLLSGPHQSCIQNLVTSIKNPCPITPPVSLCDDWRKIEKLPKNLAKLGRTWQKLANSSAWDFPDCVPAIHYSTNPPLHSHMLCNSRRREIEMRFFKIS